MTKMKHLSLAVAACAMSANTMAIELKSDGKDYGKVDFQLKAMHILGAENNGYDPSEGTSYLVKLKYLTPSWKNARIGAGFYNNGDLLNLTDFDAAAAPDKRLARGMFVAPGGEEKSLMGEVYVNYVGNKFEINAGRQLYNTPLTNITYSTMPNFHTAFGISTTALKDFEFSFDQVTQMSYGARAATDFGLIGEGTQTAGAVTSPVEERGGIGQAKFEDISLIATGNESENTNGISVLSATYTGFKNAEISAWNYYADKISNTFYIDGNYGMPVRDLKLKLFAQFLSQTDQGSLVKDNPFGGTGNFSDGIDFNLFGLKAVLKGKKWMAFAAYNNSSGDTGMYNSWGGDPAYTSSIFSRNEYRKDVSAYKIGVKYNFMKNLFVMLSHADYGQSDSVGRIAPGPGNTLTAQRDAKETDLVLVYKPVKDLMLKLFHANRTSEYDGSNGQELKQAHTRFVASYKF